MTPLRAAFLSPTHVIGPPSVYSPVFRVPFPGTTLHMPLCVCICLHMTLCQLSPAIGEAEHYSPAVSKCRTLAATTRESCRFGRCTRHRWMDNPQ